MSTTGDRPASGSPPSRPGAGGGGGGLRAQALRLPGAHRPHRGPGPPRAPRRRAGAAARGPDGRHGTAARLAGGPAPGAVAEGIRRPGTARRRRGPGRVSRGAARTGVGRVRRPVHQRGEDHHQPAAGQARRPPAHRDSAQVRLPDRSMTVAVGHQLTTLAAAPGLSPRTIRMRLTLIYGGLFLICGAGLLAITHVLVSNPTAGYFSAPGPHGSTLGVYARRPRPPRPPPPPPTRPAGQ